MKKTVASAVFAANLSAFAGLASAEDEPSGCDPKPTKPRCRIDGVSYYNCASGEWCKTDGKPVPLDPANGVVMPAECEASYVGPNKCVWVP